MAGFDETKDSLQSSAIIRIQDLVSEGPIQGLTDDLKSVFFNGTPLQNADGSKNFADAAFQIATGLPDQPYMSGFPDVEDDANVNTEITFTVPVTHAISTEGVDAARITILFPNGLTEQFADSGGSGVKGSSVTLSIQTASENGIFHEVLRPTVTGKASNPYEVSYRVERPSGATLWSVKVQRITVDSTSSLISNKTVFERCTEIQDIKLQYNNSAYIGTTVSAKSTGNSVPQRTFDIQGLLVPIPVNYDPINRTYSGDWDGGSFYNAWTDNPAWIILEMIRNTRWGVGDIDDDIIDFGSFYAASQYNDELVDNGNNGDEPRFTFNYQIMNRDNDWTLIQQMASNSRCVVVNDPLVVMYQDRPGQVVKVVTNANVVDGMFNYTGSAGNTRYTQCNVTFNDKNNKFLPKTITYQDDNAISLFGQTSSDVSAYACTSEGQARRQAVYVVDTSVNTTETVTYQCAFSQMDLQPFDIIEIMDNDYAGKSLGGIVQGGTTTSIILDRSVTLLAGKTYTIKFLGVDGETLVARTLSDGAGAHSTVHLFSALTGGNSGATLQGRPYIIQSPTDVAARPFRVSSISEPQRGVFAVTAVQYDATKYSRIEGGISIPPPTYSNYGGNNIKAPANVRFAVEQFVSDNRKRVELKVTWDQVIDSTLQDYVFQWRYNNGSYSAPIICATHEYNIVDITPGTYDVMVRTESVKNIKSTPTTASFGYVATGSNNLNPPTGLQLAPGTGTGLNFATRDLAFLWSAPVTNNVGLAGYTVKIYNNAANALIGTVKVDNKTLSYTYPFNTNSHLSGGPYRQLRVEVYSTDVQGLLSITSANAVFTNPAPSIPTVDVIPSNKNIGIQTTTTPSDPDFVGLAVWISEVQGFTPDASTLHYATGQSISIPEPDGTYYVRVAGYDSFGIVALNISGEQTVQVTDFALYVEPQTPSGLTLTSKLITTATGQQSANLTATWTDPDINNISTYTLRIRDITNPGGFSYVDTSDLAYTWNNLLCAETYGVSIRANNVHVSSAYGTEVTLKTIADTVGPGAPSALITRAAFQNIFLDWTDPVVSDFDHTEVWAALSSDNRGNATLVGTSSSSNFTHTALSTGQTWFYWVRAVDTSGNVSPFFPASANNGVAATTIGTATADYQNLSIVSAAIQDGAIDNAKIANATIDAAKIANATITAAQIKEATIGSAQIGRAAITEAQIDNAAIKTAHIGKLQVEEAHIKRGELTNAVIQNGTIIEASIGEAAITTGKIHDLAVTTGKIDKLAVTNAQIAKGTITYLEVDQATIQGANIAKATIVEGNIQDLAVSTLKIAGNAVTVPSSSYQAAVLTATSGTTITAQTLAVTTSGGQVFITYGHISTLTGAGTTGTGTITITITRDSTEIYKGQVSRTGGSGFWDSISRSETPPAGIHSYVVKVTYNQTSSSGGLLSSLNCANRSLFTIETKK